MTTSPTLEVAAVPSSLKGYFDDLAAAGVTDWGSVGVGLNRPAFHAYLERMMAEEIVPLLPEVPRIDLGDIAQEAQADPPPLLSQMDVFHDLGRDEGFIAAVGAELAALENEGPREAIERCLAAGEQDR